jgi:hypothetical protein
LWITGGNLGLMRGSGNHNYHEEVIFGKEAAKNQRLKVNDYESRHKVTPSLLMEMKKIPVSGRQKMSFQNLV